MPSKQHWPSRAILRPSVAIDTPQWPPDTFTWLANRNCHRIKCWSFFLLLLIPLFFLVALRRSLHSYSLNEIIIQIHGEVGTASSTPPATLIRQLKPLMLNPKHTSNPLTRQHASGGLQTRNSISRSNPNHQDFYYVWDLLWKCLKFLF